MNELGSLILDDNNQLTDIGAILVAFTGLSILELYAKFIIECQKEETLENK